MTSLALAVHWLPRTAQKIVPWRNGAGSTREVAIEPPGAELATGFVWRISIAGVAADGPFSRFPGIDRSLWLWRGAGMDLDIDGARVRLDRPLQRVDFAGEVPVQARLLGGPTEDLNVMVARDRVRAAAAIVELAAGATWRAELALGQHVLLVLVGSLAIANGSGGPGDAVRCDGAGSCHAIANGPCTMLRASFVSGRAAGA